MYCSLSHLQWYSWRAKSLTIQSSLHNKVRQNKNKGEVVVGSLQDKNSRFPFILSPSIPHLLGLPLSKVYLKVLVAQLCPTLCGHLDCNPPGSSVLGILHARILEWVAIPFSRESSWPRAWTWVCSGRRIFYHLSHLVKMSPRKLEIMSPKVKQFVY